MTRVTFGVSASCYAANMSVKQNALEPADRYPPAARAVEEEFYVDDGLTGADSIKKQWNCNTNFKRCFPRADSS